MFLCLWIFCSTIKYIIIIIMTGLFICVFIYTNNLHNMRRLTSIVILFQLVVKQVKTEYKQIYMLATYFFYHEYQAYILIYWYLRHTFLFIFNLNKNMNLLQITVVSKRSYYSSCNNKPICFTNLNLFCYNLSRYAMRIFCLPT